MNDFARTTTTSAMLSPAQVARLTNLSRAAVYRAIERGELHASRLCGRLRVDIAELEAWKARSVVQRQGSRAVSSGRADASPSTFLDELNQVGTKSA